MSYDISLNHVETGEEEWSANYTSNVYPMLQCAFANAGMSEWKGIHGMSALAARPFLAKAIGHMIQHPEIYEPMNPENGWGSYERLVPFLTEFWKQTKMYPDAIIEIDY